MPLSNAQTRDLNFAAPAHQSEGVGGTGASDHRARRRGAGLRYGRARLYRRHVGSLVRIVIGWGDKELIEAATEQMQKLSYGHLFGGKSHEPAAALAEKAEGNFNSSRAKCSSAAPVPEAMTPRCALLWYAANARGQTKRKKIISRVMGYHGVTLAATSLTGIPSIHKGFDAPFDFAVHTRCPIIIAAPKTAKASAIIPSALPPISMR